MVLSIPNYRMAERRKLHSDLILQSCNQLDPDERSVGKKALDRVPKFGTRGFGIFRRAQLLIHSFTSKIMHQRLRLGVETAAQCRHVLPHRSVG